MIMASSYDDIASQPPYGESARGGQGRHISQLLVTRVDFRSLKHCMAVNNNDDGRAVLYRSEIDHDIAEISLLYHFGAVGRGRTVPIWSVGKVVPRDEIFINPSDSKHVMELLGCSGGLGMVITTRMLCWDAFDGL